MIIDTPSLFMGASIGTSVATAVIVLALVFFRLMNQ
jgi:hypothetical protein